MALVGHDGGHVLRRVWGEQLGQPPLQRGVQPLVHHVRVQKDLGLPMGHHVLIETLGQFRAVLLGL